MPIILSECFSKNLGYYELSNTIHHFITHKLDVNRQYYLKMLPHDFQVIFYRLSYAYHYMCISSKNLYYLLSYVIINFMKYDI